MARDDHYRTVKACSARGNVSELKKAHKRAISDPEEAALIAQKLSGIFANKGNDRASMKWLVTSFNDLNSFETALWIGIKASRLDDQQTAAKYFEIAYDIDPNIKTAISLTVSHRRLGNFDEALNWAETVCEYEKTPPTTWTAAIVAKEAGNTEKAIYWHEQNFELFQSVKGATELSRLYEESGDFAQAGKWDIEKHKQNSRMRDRRLVRQEEEMVETVERIPEQWAQLVSHLRHA